MPKIEVLRFRIKYHCPTQQQLVYVREWDIEHLMWRSDIKSYYAEPFTLRTARRIVKAVKKKFPEFITNYIVEIYV